MVHENSSSARKPDFGGPVSCPNAFLYITANRELWVAYLPCSMCAIAQNSMIAVCQSVALQPRRFKMHKLSSS